jgi:pilus assembly protein CpaE
VSTGIVAVGAPPTFRQQVARSIEALPEAIEWVPTITAAEELLAPGGTPPMVIVLSPAVKDGDALGLAEYVGRTSPATAIVVVRDRGPDGLLPLAMRAGVRDVVDLTQGSDELKQALGRAVAWSEKVRGLGGEPRAARSEGRGRVHALFSSKGGTGKSFLAANLSVALSRRTGHPIAIADLDVQIGDTLAYFGREAKGTIADLVAQGDNATREAVLSAGTNLDGHVFGYGSPPDPAAQPLPPEAVGRLLRALRSTFAHTVVDTPAGYTDHVLSVLDIADEILLVAMLDVVAVRHMAVALHTLASLGLPRERFRVVLNRADSKVGLTPQEVERVTKVRVDVLVPSSRLVPSSLNNGVPVVTSEPRSQVARSVAALADMLAASATPPTTNAPKRRLLRRG